MPGRINITASHGTNYCALGVAQILLQAGPLSIREQAGECEGRFGGQKCRSWPLVPSSGLQRPCGKVIIAAIPTHASTLPIIVLFDQYGREDVFEKLLPRHKGIENSPRYFPVPGTCMRLRAGWRPKSKPRSKHVLSRSPAAAGDQTGSAIQNIDG